MSPSMNQTHVSKYNPKDNPNICMTQTHEPNYDPNYNPDMTQSMTRKNPLDYPGMTDMQSKDASIPAS
eukprot:5655117-Amphidinium_carterae.1